MKKNVKTKILKLQFKFNPLKHRLKKDCLVLKIMIKHLSKKIINAKNKIQINRWKRKLNDVIKKHNN